MRKAMGGGPIMAGAAALALAVSGAGAQDAPKPAAKTQTVPAAKPYSPPLREPLENNLYFGDLHLHTKLSLDAFFNGTVAVGPEDAYRFARGHQVTADNGMTAKLRRPLDFMAITDHAEYLGVFPLLAAGDPGATEGWAVGQTWAKWLRGDKNTPMSPTIREVVSSNDPAMRQPDNLSASIWGEVVKVADRYNQPGQFSALVGFEWSSTVNGNNLHRNVIFRDGGDSVARIRPFSAIDSRDPEKLWQALERYEASGVSTLAIPHNGNLSNGLMFAPNRLDGEPINAAYAQARARWEPIVEITQMKGDGESHPLLSPDDGFADFENWDDANIVRSEPKQPWMLQYEYARAALKQGLLHQRRLGVNPFAFGVIGSTDSHTGLATTNEENFFGKFLDSEPAKDRWQHETLGRLLETMDVEQRAWELGASGLAAVWAPENTRAAIFDALKRREVYGTTGSRILLRVFGGYDFAPSDIDRPDYARIGYDRGVPMGGMLGPSSKAPRFLIHAVKDPDGANLDRVQVIKGWVDAQGNAREKVYDAAWSGDRKRDSQGRVGPVGSTVSGAEYRNSIGAAELATFWEDPDFREGEAAFYYVRVIEIPRPRWTAYDIEYFGSEMPDSVPRTVQDRAYSSAIWYKPRS